MRKAIVAVGCLVLFGAGWTFGDNKVLVLNGASWKTFSNPEKNMYVLGFAEGYRQGVRDGVRLMRRWGDEAVAKAHYPPVPPLSEEEVDTEAEAQAQAQKYPFAGRPRTVNQYVDAISAFYGDFRNMPVCWENALRFSAASLEGRAPTEQELDAARKAGAESGCK